MQHHHTLGTETYPSQTLREAYEKGAEWDSHKALAEKRELLDALEEVLGYRYAHEVSRCSEVVVLQRRRDNRELTVKPFETCKRRWCPVCEWRKSRKRWALLVERLPSLIEKNSPCRFLLLTLTIRNCSISDLPKTYERMMNGWRRLTNTKTALGRLWPATAWVRALEITFPKVNEAHPHFHVLLAVKPSYFKGNEYVNQLEWTKRWRQALRVGYDPIVDIRCVKPLGSKLKPTALNEALGGLREVSKYVVKPSLYQTQSALKGVLSLSSKRFIDSGGWLRGVLSVSNGDGVEIPDVHTIATYYWNWFEKKYLSRRQ